MKKKSSFIKHGLLGIAVCTFFTFVFLFGTNAGWWTVTSGPAAGVAMFFGWPFVLGSVIGGLSQMDSGSEKFAVIISFAGLILNVMYAFAMGALIGHLLRRK